MCPLLFCLLAVKYIIGVPIIQAALPMQKRRHFAGKNK